MVVTDVVGQTVHVYWENDDEWFPGVIGDYHPEKGFHIQYFDGDDEWLKSLDKNVRLDEKANVQISQEAAAPALEESVHNEELGMNAFISVPENAHGSTTPPAVKQSLPNVTASLDDDINFFDDDHTEELKVMHRDLELSGDSDRGNSGRFEDSGMRSGSFRGYGGVDGPNAREERLSSPRSSSYSSPSRQDWGITSRGLPQRRNPAASARFRPPMMDFRDNSTTVGSENYQNDMDESKNGDDYSYGIQDKEAERILLERNESRRSVGFEEDAQEAAPTSITASDLNKLSDRGVLLVGKVSSAYGLPSVASNGSTSTDHLVNNTFFRVLFIEGGSQSAMFRCKTPIFTSDPTRNDFENPSWKKNTAFRFEIVMPVVHTPAPAGSGVNGAPTATRTGGIGVGRSMGTISGSTQRSMSAGRSRGGGAAAAGGLSRLHNTSAGAAAASLRKGMVGREASARSSAGRIQLQGEVLVAVYRARTSGGNEIVGQVSFDIAEVDKSGTVEYHSEEYEGRFLHGFFPLSALSKGGRGAEGAGAAEDDDVGEIELELHFAWRAPQQAPLPLTMSRPSSAASGVRAAAPGSTMPVSARSAGGATSSRAASAQKIRVKAPTGAAGACKKKSNVAPSVKIVSNNQQQQRNEALRIAKQNEQMIARLSQHKTKKAMSMQSVYAAAGNNVGPSAAALNTPREAPKFKSAVIAKELQDGAVGGGGTGGGGAAGGKVLSKLERLHNLFDDMKKSIAQAAQENQALKAQLNKLKTHEKQTKQSIEKIKKANAPKPGSAADILLQQQRQQEQQEKKASAAGGAGSGVKASSHAQSATLKEQEALDGITESQDTQGRGLKGKEFGSGTVATSMSLEEARELAASKRRAAAASAAVVRAKAEPRGDQVHDGELRGILEEYDVLISVRQGLHERIHRAREACAKATEMHETFDEAQYLALTRLSYMAKSHSELNLHEMLETELQMRPLQETLAMLRRQRRRVQHAKKNKLRSERSGGVGEAAEGEGTVAAAATSRSERARRLSALTASASGALLTDHPGWRAAGEGKEVDGCRDNDSADEQDELDYVAYSRLQTLKVDVERVRTLLDSKSYALAINSATEEVLAVRNVLRKKEATLQEETDRLNAERALWHKALCEYTDSNKAFQMREFITYMFSMRVRLESEASAMLLEEGYNTIELELMHYLQRKELKCELNSSNSKKKIIPQREKDRASGDPLEGRESAGWKEQELKQGDENREPSVYVENGEVHEDVSK